MFKRKPAYRQAPPLANPRFVGVHIADTSGPQKPNSNWHIYAALFIVLGATLWVQFS